MQIRKSDGSALVGPATRPGHGPADEEEAMQTFESWLSHAAVVENIAPAWLT